jgi:prolyl oligopeptidase
MRVFGLVWIQVAVLAGLFVPGVSAQQAPGPKRTAMEPVHEEIHGVTIADPYRWLEDGQSPKTRAWLDDQIQHTRAVLAGYKGREAIHERLSKLMRIDSMSTPIVRNDRYFFSRRSAEQDLPVFFVRDGVGGKDVMLLDPATLSADKTVNVSSLGVSEDGGWWIYGVRQGGEDETTVQIMDVETRKDLPDRLPKARYFGVALKPDKSGFYYARMNTKEGPRVYYHAMGTEPASDTEVFGKGFGPDKIIQVSLTADGRWLLFHVLHGAAARKSEIYVQDLHAKGPIQTIVNDLDARFTGRIGDNTLFLQTNWKAPNGRVLAVNLLKPERENWKEIIPEFKYPMQGFSLIAKKVFINYLVNVSSHEKIFAADGKPEGEVFTMPGPGTASLTGRWESGEAFLNFDSFVAPPRIYRYDAATGNRDDWFMAKVPIDSAGYVVRQVRFRSKDGTDVPMFVVHRKDLKLDGNQPTLLTGYGGFNLSRTPSYSPLAAMWVEAGGVYALPSLRGGGEFGETWHRAGMLEQKQNTFDDFLAAAEWLIANKYTNPRKLAIAGGSNGGLLVGAALTQRPELFRAVVCSVPLLDMVRYHKFLVARFWAPEYGSAENAEQFKYIHAYSPYHRVKDKTPYPAVLFMTGDSDTRVDPLHARKMAALLQEKTGSGSDRPILLHYDTKSGHSGGKPVTKQIDDLADELLFLFTQLGMQSPSIDF